MMNKAVLALVLAILAASFAAPNAKASANAESVDKNIAELEKKLEVMAKNVKEQVARFQDNSVASDEIVL